jgi:glyoxylase-like metal-dependent hydrolase (beta-lactamase superfamily II)
MSIMRDPCFARTWLAALSVALLPWLAPLAQAQRSYDRPPVVKEGVTVRLTPRVHVIPDESARGVPNVGIVTGTRATLVIDPGLGRRSGEAVMNEVRKLAPAGELYLVNTHFHPEHTTGELAFPENVKIIRVRAQQQDVEELGLAWVKEFAARSPELADMLGEVKGFRAPAVIFENHHVLDLGGVRVQLIGVGPAHTRGDTAVYVEGDGVLFSGDLAMRRAFPAFIAPHSRASSWAAGLDALASLRPLHVVGAHYGMGDGGIINEHREFLAALRVRVAALKREGRTADQTAVQLREEFRAKYPDWDQPLRVHTAAAAIYAELP